MKEAIAITKAEIKWHEENKGAGPSSTWEQAFINGLKHLLDLFHQAQASDPTELDSHFMIEGLIGIGYDLHIFDIAGKYPDGRSREDYERQRISELLDAPELTSTPTKCQCVFNRGGNLTWDASSCPMHEFHPREGG